MRRKIVRNIIMWRISSKTRWLNTGDDNAQFCIFFKERGVFPYFYVVVIMQFKHKMQINNRRDKIEARQMSVVCRKNCDNR